MRLSNYAHDTYPQLNEHFTTRAAEKMRNAAKSLAGLVIVLAMGGAGTFAIYNSFEEGNVPDDDKQLESPTPDQSKGEKPQDQSDKQQDGGKKDKPEEEQPTASDSPAGWNKALSDLSEELGVVVATGKGCVAGSPEESQGCIDRATEAYQEVSGLSPNAARFGAACGSSLLNPSNERVVGLIEDGLILDRIADSANAGDIGQVTGLCVEAVEDFLDSPFRVDQQVAYGIPGQ